MIRSFRDREAEALLRHGRVSPRLRSIARVGQRKLSQLNAAAQLADLAIFPGNRLEPLRGDRQGQHSIRINDQYRLCFVWREGGAEEVEIVDYH
jgi:toxin HigB-1